MDRGLGALSLAPSTVSISEAAAVPEGSLLRPWRRLARWARGLMFPPRADCGLPLAERGLAERGLPDSDPSAPRLRGLAPSPTVLLRPERGLAPPRGLAPSPRMLRRPLLGLAPRGLARGLAPLPRGLPQQGRQDSHPTGAICAISYLNLHVTSPFLARPELEWFQLLKPGYLPPSATSETSATLETFLLFCLHCNRHEDFSKSKQVYSLLASVTI